MNLKAVLDNLECIRHGLVTHHGLYATDQQGVVMDTDANKNSCFEIDLGNELASLNQLQKMLMTQVKVNQVLLKIKDLEDSATPSPWEWMPQDIETSCDHIQLAHGMLLAVGDGMPGFSNDMRYVVEVRNLLSDLFEVLSVEEDGE